MIYFHSLREILITILNGLFKVIYSFSPGHIIIVPRSLGSQDEGFLSSVLMFRANLPSQC